LLRGAILVLTGQSLERRAFYGKFRAPMTSGASREVGFSYERAKANQWR